MPTEGGFREKCGVVGVFGHPEAANLVYLGLCALQHRGQEAAGIVSSEGQVLVSHRGLGLVTDIFPEAIIRKLRGQAAIGHNRYSTTGGSQHLKNAQPLVVEYGRGGLALAHNGNLVNAERLRAELEARGSIFQSTVDTEVIIHLIAAATADTLEDRVVEALHQVRGAYSLVFLAPDKLIAVRDPYGFRPLVLGRVKGAWVVASETCALDLVDAEYEREIEPGEMVVMTEDGLSSYHPLAKAPGAKCIFEYIYFARPDSTIFGRNVYQARKELGRTLARESPVPADIVIPVPDSGVPAAIGYAEAAGIPFEMGLIRNHYVGRTFIEPRDAIRHFGVKVKLNAQRSVLEGKRVVVVDDSIVRGTTSRKIVKMIRDAGAVEVHMRISSPPTTNPCYYGIDTPNRAELIASSHDVEEIRRYITADSLTYLSEEGMYAFLGGKQAGFCDACFTGRYPVPFEDTGTPRQLVLFEAQDERLKRTIMVPTDDESWDFLIVGSGIAGLTFALNVADHGRVAIVTKDRSDESNSSYAQGGVATVWSPEDSFASHAEDTLTAGAGLCHEDIVQMVVREGPDRIRDLIALGTRFDAHGEGDAFEYDLGREGGHSMRRVLHFGDLTGQEIVRALTLALRGHPNVTVFENALAVDLLMEKGSARAAQAAVCWGAYVYDRMMGNVRSLRARATVLCTGGAGKVYLYTTNPDVATGDGVAIAYRAGATVGNLEFFQFHPTCLYHPQAKSFLISEALRGEGARLRLPDGSPFMDRYHRDAELAPRDVVARAIDHEMKVHGYEHVYLDITHQPASWIEERFPNIVGRCRQLGIDPTREWMPVVPAAHYLCGGVATDQDGRTSIPRLYACGEVAMTGLHGANRLASNSLLEGLVFGYRAAMHATTALAAEPAVPPRLAEWNTGTAVNSDESVVVAQNWDEVRRTMWNFVGIVRSNRRLERARKRIAMLQEEIREYYWDFLVTGDLLELRNIATVAELIVRCALSRRESRGLHYTIDYPNRDDAHWRHDSMLPGSGI